MENLSNAELTRLFLAIGLILGSARCFGYLFQVLKMPKVIGEITGGLVLGPTVLGFLAPVVFTNIFTAFPSEGKLISLFYWVGLVLLMFVSGFGIQRSYDKRDTKIILALLIGSTTLPFLAGWMATSAYDLSGFLGPKGSMPSLRIIVGISVAVTSIPVISKIFIDLGIIHTKFAELVLATATIHDFILWIGMGIAIKLSATASVSGPEIALTVATTAAFFALSFFLLLKFIKYRHHLRMDSWMRSSPAGFALLTCFFFAGVANLLGINIVFGAFLAGIVVSNTLPPDKFTMVKKAVSGISLSVFVPIYFGIVGLRLDLVHHFDWLFLLQFLVFSMFFAGAGTFIAAWLAVKDRFSSFNFAVAMNARGGPGIVIATVAFDLALINATMFVTLVMTAIITSLIAGFWFRLVQVRNWVLLKETG